MISRSDLLMFDVWQVMALLSDTVSCYKAGVKRFYCFSHPEIECRSLRLLKTSRWVLHHCPLDICIYLSRERLPVHVDRHHGNSSSFKLQVLLIDGPGSRFRVSSQSIPWPSISL